ncbi:hypothetical protein SAMN06272765_7224 [Streptomyces sp. Ag109_G2-15]|nr:hypothetical protein SAMN06272765_7224 [Streptomyces sp. Ag109_G2-15]
MSFDVVRATCVRPGRDGLGSARRLEHRSPSLPPLHALAEGSARTWTAPCTTRAPHRPRSMRPRRHQQGSRRSRGVSLGRHFPRIAPYRPVSSSNGYKIPLHSLHIKGDSFARTSCCLGRCCCPGRCLLQRTHCFGGDTAVHQHGTPLRPPHHRGVRLDAPSKAEGQVRDGEVQGRFPVVLAALAGHLLAPPRREVLVQVDRLNAGRLLCSQRRRPARVHCQPDTRGHPGRAARQPGRRGDTASSRADRIRGTSGRCQKPLPKLFT